MLPTREVIRTVELPRPTLRVALSVRVVVTLGLASVLRRRCDGNTVELALVSLALVATVSLLAISTRRRVGTWVDAAAAYLSFVVIALARDVTGGPASGIGSLVVLPILWLAITGTK